MFFFFNFKNTHIYKNDSTNEVTALKEPTAFLYLFKFNMQFKGDWLIGEPTGLTGTET